MGIQRKGLQLNVAAGNDFVEIEDRNGSFELPASRQQKGMTAHQTL
jgi:hypothetical protein